MKKIILIALALLMMLPAFCLSESTEPKDYPFYSGTYITGTDIKAGRYILTVVSGQEMYNFGKAEVWSSIDAVDENKRGDIQNVSLFPGESVNIKLEDGNALVLDHASWKIRDDSNPFTP